VSIGNLGKTERVTQRRVIALFRDELGYDFHGDWSDRANNHVEEALLAAWLQRRGTSAEAIARALQMLRTEASNHGRDLYSNNKAVHGLLRYGVQVKTDPGTPTETVPLVDWRHPERNDFSLAEEVTLSGNHERRPDLVLYLNGIAIAVIELKNSRVSIGEGIRQCLSNQRPEFHAWFFSTVQFVFAGNDSEGLRYGTIGTPEKMFQSWKEDAADNAGFKLDKYLRKLCSKPRLLELIHDFVLFDGGVKKLPRPHQYFGVKQAQAFVQRREGGIIWHTQGSGKSLVMVLLARWILEHNPRARIAVITDRDELDKQIERVFRAAGETIERATDGRTLMRLLGQAAPRLLCSLVHKFGRRDVDDLDAFLADLAAEPSPTQGEVFVFVDECHRTQSGKLHRLMKAMLPGAVFVGFTGTPLLQQDRATSREVFGGYIHTYKFGEAVADQVVLDLHYEARDIEQQLSDGGRVDAWFEAKTRGLNDWQKAELRSKWGTMQHVLSSRARMDRVVADIVADFGIRPRLMSERGNAILVASSIYEACKYFEILGRTPLRGKCAVITSYNPQAQDVTKEEVGANTETDKQFIYNTYTALLQDVPHLPNRSATEVYEDAAKKRFIEEPANMKLLVVVNKLLTGFDAPPCTYLYLDRALRDHDLFQAICRTNRLDGEDKDFGHIVDYKDLFERVRDAIRVYSSELADDEQGGDSGIQLQDWREAGRERLDQALEALQLLCEPVAPPRTDLQHIQWFCGNVEIPAELQETAQRRVTLYQCTAAFARAYANLANDLAAAGYSTVEQVHLQGQLQHFVNLREIVRRASGETLDLKAYEADMRFLLDSYIEAAAPRTISPFEGMGLLELIERTGIDQAVDSLPEGVRANPDAVAETITNNVRARILREHLRDPSFYERMSRLLQEVIEDLRARRIDYQQFLQQIADLAKQVQTGADQATPSELVTAGQRALFSNLVSDDEAGEARHDQAGEPGQKFGSATRRRIDLARAVHETVLRVRPAGWRGNQAKVNIIKQALLSVLGDDEHEVERVFAIIEQQGEY
jgi:type I restriction enzyme R subunit